MSPVIDTMVETVGGKGEFASASAEIVLVGLNDRTTPIELRERVSLAAPQRVSLLHGLHRLTSESVVISTCNRVEIYAVVTSGASAVEEVVRFVADFHGVDPAELRPHLYIHRGMAAVRHLFAVACGLDSMIVGEVQIIGQVRADYEAAIACDSVGSLLFRLFQSALRLGKQVRTVTRIGRSARSVGSAGVELVRRKREDLSDAAVLILGTGVIGEQVARAVAARGVRQLVVANRTYTRAVELAARVGGRPAELACVSDHLETADIVFACTGAPAFVLDCGVVATAMSRRRNRPLLVLDLALPRNVEPGVGGVDNVDLFDLDDLQNIGPRNVAEHRRDVGHAWRLLEAEVGAFEKWIATREVVPTISALRGWAEDIRIAEVQKALDRLGIVTERQRDLIEAMSVGIVNKLLHPPTVGLKASAGRHDQRARQLAEVRSLFGLAEPIAAVQAADSTELLARDDLRR